MKKLMLLFLCMCLGAFIAVPSTVLAVPVPVDLELLLLVDVSGSIDANEYNIQKQGYVSAFEDAAIKNLLEGLPGGIAVAYGEWSYGYQQVMQVDWMHLQTASDSDAFASAIANSTRLYSGLTAPGSAINWGVPKFGVAYDGSRTIIDISGDGSENDGANTSNAAAAAWNAGITVNGLSIGGTSIYNWYLSNIVTPGHGTLWVADNFTDFGPAVYDKIYMEVSGPEPATMLLLGSSLIGLAWFRRRFKKK